METKSSAKRNQWIAVIFAFFCVGLGHVYVGKLQRGLIFIIVFIGLWIGIPLLGLPSSIYGFVFWNIAVYGVYFYQIADAERIAKRAIDYSSRTYNKWYWYTVVFLVVGAIELVVIAYKDVFGGYYSFRIPAGSMEPALKTGDFIVTKRLVASDKIQRGDIVIFQYPVNHQLSYIKRVVAVEGDTVALKRGRLIVNGVAVTEPYVLESNSTKPDSQTFGPKEVPEEHVFVLGDKRDGSNDSRFWGSLPAEMIYARPLYVWMNYQPSKGIDWDRIGFMVN